LDGRSRGAVMGSTVIGLEIRGRIGARIGLIFSSLTETIKWIFFLPDDRISKITNLFIHRVFSKISLEPGFKIGHVDMSE
jgi:hypothetical protein